MISIDVGSKAEYPGNVLTNFAAHRFCLDEIVCESMEGFIQSLKCPLVEEQLTICKLVGYQAKKAGRKYQWKRKQILFWNKCSYVREGQEYQDLLTRAYNALFENEEFKKALVTSGNVKLTHKIGKDNPRETVLTEEEFIGQLNRLRVETRIKSL